MTGVSLSRWTMSYFAAAVAALLAAEALMAAGYGFPAAGLRAPDTLVLVHLVAIGWLSLLMCGAAFQFVPVLVARRLHSNALPLPTLICLVAGLAALLLGFLQMAGRLAPGFPFLEAGGGLLGLGFALVIGNLGLTMWRARPLPLPTRFVTVGLLSLAATAAYGVTFTLVLGDTVTADTMIGEGAAAVTATGVPFHAIAGLGGWLTFTAMGVSYRLLAMFMLAPEPDGRRTRAALYLGAAALAVAIAGGVLVARPEVDAELVLAVVGGLGLAALVLYGADVIHLYRMRRRRRIELNSRVAAVALASLAAAVLLMGSAVAGGQAPEQVAAAVFLATFGWLSGLGLGKLYKIVAFLTWLECYGPVLGKTAAPRVQDLVVERRAGKWFVAYFVATWSATLALLAGQGGAFQIAAAAMLVATAGIAAQLLRTRRLADVDPERRIPAGASRPRLLLAATRPS